MKKTRSKKKIVLIILLCFLVLLIGGWWAFSVSIYNENFDKRFESYGPYMLYVDDFEGLSCSEYTFASDKGQKPEIGKHRASLQSINSIRSEPQSRVTEKCVTMH